MFENLVSFGSDQLLDRNFFMNWYVKVSNVKIYNNKSIFKIYFPHYIESTRRDIIGNV